jgi:hypothetical protein
MKEIFENYVEYSFGAREQLPFKFKQFEYNYRKYFPKAGGGGGGTFVFLWLATGGARCFLA